jgi:hypothetical protein
VPVPVRGSRDPRGGDRDRGHEIARPVQCRIWISEGATTGELVSTRAPRQVRGSRLTTRERASASRYGDLVFVRCSVWL